MPKVLLKNQKLSGFLRFLIVFDLVFDGVDGRMVAGGSAAGRLSQKVAQGWRVKFFEKWHYIQLSERQKFGGSYAKEMFMQVRLNICTTHIYRFLF